MSAEIADVLDSAADLIERDGWIGDVDSGASVPVSAMCVQVACSQSTESFPLSLEATYALAASLGINVNRTQPSRCLSAVWEWNDTPGRTEQEVLAALRRAAKNERSKDDGVA